MKPQIIICFIFATSTIFGQQFNVNYNPDIHVDKKAVSDTIYWSYIDSLNFGRLNKYPQNSDIQFIQGNDSILLGSINAKIAKDTLYISISKISYGQHIDVLIKTTNNLTFEGAIKYWTALSEQERFLKLLDCNLELNRNEFKKGQNLMGKINLHFERIMPDEYVMIDENVDSGHKIQNRLNGSSIKSGEVIGNFNVIIE